MRVVVAEDNPIIAADLSRMLADCGCQTLGTAADIGEAMRLVARERPDIVFADLRLRDGVTGPGLIEACRAMDVPVVAITGEGGTIRDSLDPSVPVLTKPVSRSELAGAVAGVPRAGVPAPQPIRPKGIALPGMSFATGLAAH